MNVQLDAVECCYRWDCWCACRWYSPFLACTENLNTEFTIIVAIDMLYHTEDASSRVFIFIFLSMLSEVIKIISAYTCVAHAHSACIFIKTDYNYITKSQVGYVKIAPPWRGIFFPFILFILTVYLQGFKFWLSFDVF